MSKYTNSGLVDCVVLSHNYTNGRKHAIDTITPHCVVGQLTAEGIGACFPMGAGASCNYGIGKDGRVVLVVEEKNRSWCSSNADNDNRAVTIECASDGKQPYAFNDAVYNKLITLCADICKRNGKTKLLWLGSKETTINYTPAPHEMLLTVHRWFANKSCPGDWLYSRMSEFAAKVNAKLSAGASTTKTSSKAKVEAEPLDSIYTVQIGAYSKKANAESMLSKVKAKGFDCFIVNVSGLYKVQVGAYAIEANAKAMKAKLKAAGFDAFISVGSGIDKSTDIKVGDKVKMQKHAPQYGKTAEFASWVYDTTLYVREVDGSRIVVSTLSSGDVTGAVNKKYLTKV